MFKALSIGKAFLLFLLLFQVGCTQKFQDVSDTVAAAYDSYVDVELSKQDILAIPYASSYLRLGNQKQIVVVLAFADDMTFINNKKTKHKQLKWVSADRAMTVTEQGRLTKTLNFPYNNLNRVSGDVPAFDLNQNAPMTFTLTYDREKHYRYGFSATVTRTKLTNETVVTPLATTQTTLFVERVEFPTLSSTFDNYFWVDKDGNTIKSIQHLGPNMMPVELTTLQGYSS